MLGNRIYKILLLLLLTSCLVSPEGDDNPDCKTGEVFNKLTRSCSAGGLAPQPSLRSFSISEDVETTISLSYSDTNNGQANNCSVFNIFNSDLDIYSPLLETSPTDATNTANSASMAASFGSAFDISMTGYANAAQSALTDFLNEKTHAGRVASLEQIVLQTREVGNRGVAIAHVTAQTLGQTALYKADELEKIKNYIKNRCYCVGGQCSTVLKSKSNYHGLSGFSYTLSDAQDGASDPVEVSVTVTSVNDAPVVYNFNVVQGLFNYFDESATSTASTYSFTIPLAEEVDSSDVLFTDLFRYELVTAPTKGTISDCMGLNGSLTNDRTCNYTPNDGNDYLVGTSASATVDGIQYSSSVNGTWGNDISIEIIDEVGLGSSPYVVVTEKSIKIFAEAGVTQISHVDSLIDNDKFVRTLIDIGSTNVIVPPTNFVTATSVINLAGGTDGHDKFTYRAFDNQDYSSVASVDISLDPVDDPPVIDSVAMQPITINEDQEIDITIIWSDAEDDPMLAGQAGCSLTAKTGVPSYEVRRKCSCDNSTLPSVCTFKIAPIPHFNGTINDFDLTVVSALASSSSVILPITVNSVNDPAFPAFVNIEVVESETSVAEAYNFSIPTALDVDIPTNTLSYYIVDEPLNGTISNCLGKNGSSVNDLDCVYTPANGNLTGRGSPALRVFQDLKIEATFDGIQGEEIYITYTHDSDMDPGEVRVVNDALTINIYFNSGTVTASSLASAINSSAKNVFVPTIVKASVVGSASANQTSMGQANLVAGLNGMDYFTYLVDDGVTPSADRIKAVVNFNVSESNDKPVLCSYSKYKDAHECGLKGCIGDDSPVNNIIPSKADLVFYHTTEAVCYKSSGTTAQDWAIVDNFIADQSINEKDKVIIDEIKVDEGGGDSSEDNETILITNVTSSDNVLVPLANIKFFFNEVDINNIIPPFYPLTFGSLTESEDSSDFRIEITPAGGISGQSTITITFQDTNATPKTGTVSFDVNVFGVSVTHQGWKDIKATGPKVNKHARVLDKENVCTYSETKCTTLGVSGKECTGAGDPASLSYLADEDLATYYDSSNKNCYYASGNGATTTWNKINHYCASTPSEFAPECSNLGASCIGDGVPTIVPTKKNNFYFDKLGKVCYQSQDVSSSSDWVVYDGPGSVSIRWEDFLISGSGSITGFNVYRRIANERFDYDNPINRDVLTAVLDTYVDNEVNSKVPPIPGTVYYYEVRPILNNIPTDTNEVYKTLRVVVPPANMSFVHRWMANKAMCTKLHATDIDPTNNYRCSYTGVGGNNGYYDIGEDLLVDRYEASCNFSASPACDTAEGSCTGNFSPHTNVVASVDSIFYDRESGKCFINTDGAFSWSEIDESTASVMAKSNTPENPPLVHFDQEGAANFCAQSVNLTPIMGIGQALTKNLPTRRQQIAYSQWDTLELSDSVITSTETGFSLNSSSKCNSSAASGLDQFYTDSQIPDSNTYYSLPGSETSNIRSVMTGSYGSVFGTYGTEECQSMFNIQDAIGNVAEWTTDRMTCANPSSCTSVAQGDANAILANPGISLLGTMNDLVPSGNPYFGNYTRFGVGNVAGQSFYYGPCSDTNADDICDAPLTQMKFEEERFGAGRFIVAMGLPAHEDYPIINTTDLINDSLFQIGPTSGITSNALHDDGMILNSAEIFSDKDNCGGFVGGGSYLHGSDAGTYFFELVPCTADDPSYVKAHLTLGDFSLKSIATNGENIFINLIDPAATGQVTSASISGTTGIDVFLGTDGAGDINATAQEIVDAINADGALSLFVEAIVSGDPTRVQGSSTDPVFLEAVNSSSKRVDIGFRCVTPVTTYDE